MHSGHVFAYDTMRRAEVYSFNFALNRPIFEIQKSKFIKKEHFVTKKAIFIT